MRVALPHTSLKKTAIRGKKHSPIKVCFVIDSLSYAGTETQLLALIKSLDRDQAQPILCLLDGTDETSQMMIPADCPTLCLGLKRLLGPKAITAAIRLRKFWRNHRVDIVQTYFLDSTYFAAPLARLSGIRNVIRVRNNVGYWLTRKHKILGKFMGLLCRYTLTNSEMARQQICESESGDPSRIEVIENGVDIERFDDFRLPDLSTRRLMIGAVANLRPVKNIDGLIEAASEIIQEHPGICFEIAGEGDERNRLMELISAKQLQEHFTLKGAVKDIPGFLRTLDIAILCSHSESMSNALLEYMASAKAIIATDVGANATILGNTGVIVPAGSHRELVQVIELLISDPEKRVRIAKAARERVIEKYDRIAMVRRFESFWKSLLK